MSTRARPPAPTRIVYFDFDSFVVKDEFRPLIEAHAKRMAANRNQRTTIEGHTDERGGREYNLALGQKRAEAVLRSLALLGVADNQLEAVSFGKERPAVQGSDEAAWAKNRRAELKDRDEAACAPPRSSQRLRRWTLAASRGRTPAARRSRIRGVCWSAMVLAASAGSVQAQLFPDNEARKAILELRASDEQTSKRLAELATANKELLEQVQQLRRSLLDLNNQLEALRADLARQRGSNEQLARDVAELQRRQKDIAQGVDDRIRKLEPQKVAVDGKEFLADADEKRQYDEAFALIRSGDFAGAATALQRVQPAAIRPAATSTRCASGSATRCTASASTRKRSPASAPSSPARPSTRACPRRCWRSPTARPR